MGRRRTHRKSFPCGHKGLGRICHRCQQQTLPMVQDLSKTVQKDCDREAWLASFDSDPIDLRGLPKHVVTKSRQILHALSQGTSLHHLRAQRFRHDRTRLRIAVTPRYRMLCDDVNGRIVPRAVISHESYNSIASNTRR